MKKKQFDKNYPKFDFAAFGNVVASIGISLDGRKDRFDKATLIEESISRASNRLLSFEDDIGYDLKDMRSGTKFEVKSAKSALFTCKRGKRTSKEIKLTNTLQNRERKKKLDCTADYLLIVDTGPNYFGVGIVPYKKVVEEYSTEKSDGYACKIPISEVEILYGPVQLNRQGSHNNYAHKKAKMQDEWIEQHFQE